MHSHVMKSTDFDLIHLLTRGLQNYVYQMHWTRDLDTCGDCECVKTDLKKKTVLRNGFWMDHFGYA